MLYFSFIVSLCLGWINFQITKKEYLHPSNIFYFVFIVVQFFNILVQEYYGIVFNDSMVFILLSSMGIFTIITAIANTILISKNKIEFNNKKIIHFNQWTSYLIIGIQLFTILYFYRFLSNLFVAGHGYQGNLPELINNYDQILKFNSKLAAELNIYPGKIYYYLKSFTEAIGYIALYLGIREYLLTKQINKLNLFMVVNFIVFVLMQGSRSPLFKLITAGIMMWYFLYLRINKKIISVKFIIRIINVLILVIPVSILFLYLSGRMGDDSQIDWIQYLFIYIGAPLLNLNNFLETNGMMLPISSHFGEQTFYGLYVIIARILGNTNLNMEYIIGADSWQYTNTGIDTGNVLTTFYPFVYDFGIIGSLPIIILIASYYIFTHRKLLNNNNNNLIDFSLFMYAYLINDLIMLIFSNRFFETILSIEYIRFFLFSWLLIKYINKQSIKIDNK